VLASAKESEKAAQQLVLFGMPFGGKTRLNAWI